MPALDQMIADAIRARDSAYAPYSNHPVGAVVADERGRVFAGCNVENAASPIGQCAEATAIGAMVIGGGRRLRQVVIVGPGHVPCTPCGGCRQRLREFGDDSLEIVICDSAGEILIRTTLGELLPMAFGPDNVNERRERTS